MLLSAVLACFLISVTSADEPVKIVIPSTFGKMPWDVIIEKVDRYILPLMPYWYEELEPQVSEEELTAHHMGEHNIMKSMMNVYLREWREEEPDNEFAKESILTIIENLEKVPEKYRDNLRNFGGGFVNHCFFFGILSPNENRTERVPEGKLLDDITAAFGGFKEFKLEFLESAKNLFGSGYVWLNRAPGGKSPNLSISTTRNQDSPVMAGLQPILVLDLWEHAFYIKHQYKKWLYLEDFWQLVDWSFVEKLDQWWANIEQEKKDAEERVEEVRVQVTKQAEDDAKTEL